MGNIHVKAGECRYFGHPTTAWMKIQLPSGISWGYDQKCLVVQTKEERRNFYLGLSAAGHLLAFESMEPSQAPAFAILMASNSAHVFRPNLIPEEKISSEIQRLSFRPRPSGNFQSLS